MGQSVTFLLTDSEIKKETFLEALNSMLATGEIPGLF
jgi:dynein heavy chain